MRRYPLARFAALLVLSLAMFAGAAQALTLDEAKAKGFIGETQTGYLAVVKDAAGVQQLVNSVNLERRQYYREIARKNGTSLQAVETIAGKELIERADPGEYVQDANGVWVQR